jgi:transposase-like protein
MTQEKAGIKPDAIICKLCGSRGVVKFGTYKGVQRYLCKVCNRKFKYDDTMFHMKTPVEQVSFAVNMYYEGKSIKAIRTELQMEHGNAPSTATIYEWIQKYKRGDSDIF